MIKSSAEICREFIFPSAAFYRLCCSLFPVLVFFGLWFMFGLCFVVCLFLDEREVHRRTTEDQEWIIKRDSEKGWKQEGIIKRDRRKGWKQDGIAGLRLLACLVKGGAQGVFRVLTKERKGLKIWRRGWRQEEVTVKLIWRDNRGANWFWQVWGGGSNALLLKMKKEQRQEYHEIIDWWGGGVGVGL